MKVKEYSDPRPHIIIENVFNEEILESFLQEAVGLKDKFKQGTFLRDGKTLVDTKQKHAFDIHLDEVYNNNRPGSAILRCFDNFFWSDKMQKVYADSKYPCFNYIGKTRNDNIHMIRYGNEDHYDWHTDVDDTPYGFTTMSFMLSSKKKKFTGGNFQLKFKKKVKTIPFKRNTMVIFPRICHHRATETVLKSEDPYDFRYTIQVWAT